MELLNTVMLQMILSYRWELAYVGHLMINNGQKLSCPVKSEMFKSKEIADSMKRQDILAALTSLESITIATSWRVVVLDNLVDPSIVTSDDLL